MSQRPRPFNIEEMTFEQMRKKRNMRSSQLGRVKRVLSGKIKSFYQKNWLKLHASAAQYEKDIEDLDFALTDLSKVGVPMAIY